MAARVAPAPGDGGFSFPIRLRHVLLVVVLWLGANACLPRLRAAWRLPTLATDFADYALCMVGPTGPSLLRDNPGEFWRLVRRRLVAASADDRPFARCSKAAGEITGSAAVARAHEATAETFAEYGSVSGAASFLRLVELAVSTRRLSDLAQSAWPFARGGYTNLVKASAFAPEAAHPVAPPRPGVGKGPLPARSLAFCRSGQQERAFSLGLSADRRAKMVRTLAGEIVVSETVLARSDVRVFALSCDENEAVVAIGREGTRSVAIVVCRYGGGCAELALPRLGSQGRPVEFPLDVARVDGTTVVAARTAGIVRVASSRDEGASWTPFIVAFDAAQYPDLRFDVPVPDRLFVFGHRVALGGVAPRGTATYPLLVSDDAGASFRTP